jgi:hypothetical protein
MTQCACGSVAPELPEMDPEFTFGTDEAEALGRLSAWLDEHRDHGQETAST